MLRSERLALLGVSFCVLFVAGSVIVGESEAQETAAIPQPTVVPDLRSMTTERATQIARLRGLNVVAGDYYIDPANWRGELQEGDVQIQTPPPGTKFVEGKYVAVWAFRKADASRKTVTTPDLIGSDARGAKAALAAQGLNVIFLPSARPFGEAKPDRVVLDQWPRAGQEVYAGTSVLIHFFAKP